MILIWDERYVGKRMLEMEPPEKRKGRRPKRRFMDAAKVDRQKVVVIEA